MTLGNMRGSGVRSLTVCRLLCHHRAVHRGRRMLGGFDTRLSVSDIRGDVLTSC
jgi:hypothetical protein